MRPDFGMTRSLGVVLTFLLALAILPGCGESADRPTASDPPWQTRQSDLARDLSPAATAEDIDQLVAGNHKLAIDFYQALRALDGNLCLSPFSIRIAFAMAYAGATGRTAQEIAEVMHYGLDDETLHDAFNALDLDLEKRNMPGDAENDPVELHVANAFWGKINRPFIEEYLDLLAVHYGSGVRLLDFGREPETCRRIINEWVADETRDRILDLLPEGSIQPPTVAVLTNALYFKAPWALPFQEDQTHEGVFFCLDGSHAGAPMMQQAETFGYAESDGYQALEMNYRNDELSMVFLLPSAGRFEEFEASLDSGVLAGILEDLDPASVAVTLPRFSFESPSLSLKDVLMGMGMVAPFTTPDFAGMIEGGGIWIDNAYHKTFIALDEKGTEAAAATAIVFFESAIEPPVAEFEFTADRPFVFLIRDRVTGTILFVGRVLDPSS
ncbi:MAG: serpin family protein [Candidatus Eisenbacteria sp.]|nr:serpin family protein [Candidatus Eisenbacteria bacterium]